MTEIDLMSGQKTIECIENKGTLFALIVRNNCIADRTTFYTEDNFNFQLGHIIYGKGSTIPRHIHKPVERSISGTNEVLVVQKGSCQAKIYNSEREFIASTVLEVGDVILLNGGGHEFIAIEDLQLLEIKQGPYSDQSEKERF